MSWFLNMKVRTKLILGFALVLALTTFLGVFGLVKLAAVRATTVDMYTNWLASIRLLANMRNDAANMRRQQLHFGLTKDDQDRANTMRAITAAEEAFQKDSKDYEPTITGADEKAIYDKIQEAFKPYAESDLQLAQFYQQGKMTEAIDIALNKDKELYEKVSDSVQADIDFNNKGADAANQLSTDIYTSSRTMIIIALACCIAVGLALAIFIARLISRPVQEVGVVAKQIAGGDLTGKDISVNSTDEIGTLGHDINVMHGNLKKVIVAITENAQQVAAASEEFSATSRQISANSEETTAQANVVSAATEEVNRSLHTVATAAEEMSVSVNEIAKNASEAAKVAGEALHTVTETNATIQKLGESSAEIGQVIKVITAIAQQTNLLALNATIEAARAGEAGKGFAVVANEVKELAKQTAKATEDISQRIASIQEETKGAVEAVEKISGVIGRVNEISTTIATAVEEQSAATSEISRNVTEAAKGSSEVAKNISGVAQAAQSTSTGANDSNKAAQALAEMSTSLRRLVSQFKVEGNGHATTHARN